MRRTLIMAAVAAALSASVVTRAQDDDAMRHRGLMAAPTDDADTRQLASFPPAMRRHTLANMRDHLLALTEILSAMSAGQYAEAAGIANARLGLDSPSAEGCKSDSPAGPHISRPGGMDHQMAQYMPEPMRNIGHAMHQSASAFAAEALGASGTNDPKPALSALSRVTQQCTACHAAYRIQ